MNKKADIGLVGLAVMGENLVLNMESKGFTVAVFNRTVEKVDSFLSGRGKGKNFIGCKTIEELGIVLNSVRNNPFLARLYTGPSLYYFQDKLKKMNNMKLPSKGIEEKFGDPHNMSQKCIQEYAFELIETLLENGEDEQIEEFCQESKEQTFEMNNFKWEDLATKKAYLFIGGCLIATPSPLEFARKAFGQFVSKVNFKALFKEYEKQKEVFLDKLML